MREPTRLLSRAQVSERIGFSSSTLARWTKRKLTGWPLPILTGPQREHRWREADIELWIDRQSRHPEPKRLRGALTGRAVQ